MRCEGCIFAFPNLSGITTLFVNCISGFQIETLTNLRNLTMIYINDCDVVLNLIDSGYEVKTECEFTR